MDADLSLRHLPMVADDPQEAESTYRCQLCGRCGTRVELEGEECPKRSGVLRKIVLGEEMHPRAVPWVDLNSARESHVYWIRREGGVDPASSGTFTVLLQALKMAEHLANSSRVRLEIVREDGTVAIAVDPRTEVTEEGA